MARGKRPSERSSSWSVDGIRVEINETKLGVVVRRDMSNQLEKILDRIKHKARAIVDTSFGKYRKTGQARDSIETTRIRKINQYAVAGGVEAGGARAPYVKYIHEGAAAHVIRARPENPTGLLRFVWDKGGTFRRSKFDPAAGEFTDVDRPFKARIVRTPSVNHPGIQHPVPFLVIAGNSVTGVRVDRR